MNFDLTPQLPATFDLIHIVLAGITLILFFALVLKPSKGILVDAETDDSTTDDTEDKKIDSTAVPTVKESSTGKESSTVLEPSTIKELSLIHI